MKTKYVLNSGGLKNQPERAKEFYAEVFKDLGPSPKILMCFFAQKREDWEEKFTNYSKDFHEQANLGSQPEFMMAMPADFEEQLKWCDAVYIYGGDDYLLQYWLKQFDLPKLWRGKTVATNSAGSDALAKYFWPCDWRACMDGLGILPVKFLAHHNSDFGTDDPRGSIDWNEAKKELENYGDKSLPVYALEEGEFVVIEK